MASITTRTTGTTGEGGVTRKDAPLSNTEIDTNFINLNNSKIESSDAVSTNTAEKIVLRDENGDFSANVVTVTDLNSTSDRNAKENIEKLLSPLDTLHQIEGVSFNWKATGAKSYGVIAQDLQKVLPELVSETDAGLAVSYTPLIAFLIEALKQQETRIKELEKFINNK
jgi:hypothetical protein